MAKGINKKMIAGVTALILAIGGIGGGTAVYERQQQKKRARQAAQEEDSTKKTRWIEANTVLFDDQTYGFDHRIESYLFAGTDASGNEGGTVGAGGDEGYRGAMADFLLLMVMDHTDDSYGYIQIDRNTITDVDEMNAEGLVINTRTQQICTAHWYGLTPEDAAVNTENAVKMLLGQLEEIDGYFVLNMDDIGTLNGTVGGVEVTIDTDMTSVDPAFTDGAVLTLSDEQAEAYLRARMTVGEGDNASRMDRQKQYMDSFFQKAREIVRERPGFANELWDSLKNVGETDMSGNAFSRISQMFLKGENKGIFRIEGQEKMGMTLGDGIVHEEFYPSEESLLEIMTELYSLVPVDDEEVEEED